MIYTQFGNPVKIISVGEATRGIEIEFIEDGKRDYRFIYELKADNGIAEINDVIQKYE